MMGGSRGLGRGEGGVVFANINSMGNVMLQLWLGLTSGFE